MIHPFIFIDLFCGAGGTTTGLTKAKLLGDKACKVIACVNHDPIAIASHTQNHKGVKHYTEDIKTLDLTELKRLVKFYRKTMPKSPICIWASLECTNFSKAKGGLPRDADSRTLADHLLRYIIDLDPDYVYIENVEEFMSWGPLDENGRPISKQAGSDYLRWIKEMNKTGGFEYDYRILNSADYGAHTSRKRYFAQFSRIGLPVSWPEATFAKKPELTLFGRTIKKWKPVKECLDFGDEGNSVFNRKKPLSTKTMGRIYSGLVKYVAHKTDNTLDHSNFMVKYHKTGKNITSVNEVCSTLTTKDRLALIQTKKADSYFIDKQFTSGGRHQSIESPAGSITTVPKMNLVKAEHFIMDTQFNNVGSDIENPLGVITANRKHHYLVNPSWGGHTGSIENPCPVIIARQDKAPLYMVSCDVGQFDIPIYDEDCENTVLVKQFMAEYGIVDIKMRMLRVGELLKIQGFPRWYKLMGNQSDQKKFIGNSVPPKVVKALLESSVKTYNDYLKASRLKKVA